MKRLRTMADTVLQPGFVGTSPPDWVRRRLAEGLGGVALFARNVVDADQVAELTAALRAEKPDVIVAIDEEAGDVTRLYARTGSPWPGNLALGEIDDPALTEDVAFRLGGELAAAGITLDYAPDADVNSDPNNPVIGARAFGADPDLVSRHTVAWITGLQRAGVAAAAKHFPGHGNTSVDSHLDVPVIKASRAELDAVELAPFRAAIDAGVLAIMSAHLRVPALDPDLPATLSPRIMTELLRDELGFAGLIVTDGIEMRAISDRFGLEHATVLALVAGNDAICIGGDHADEHDRRPAARRDRRPPYAAASCPRSGWPMPPRGSSGSRGPRRRPPPVRTPASRTGLAAARRAIRVTGPAPTVPAGPGHRVPAGPELRGRPGDAVGRRRAAGRAAARHDLDPRGRKRAAPGPRRAAAGARRAGRPPVPVGPRRGRRPAGRTARRDRGRDGHPDGRAGRDAPGHATARRPSPARRPLNGWPAPPNIAVCAPSGPCSPSSSSVWSF